MHGIPGLEIELAGKRTWPIVNVYLTMGRLTLYRLTDDSPSHGFYRKKMMKHKLKLRRLQLYFLKIWVLFKDELDQIIILAKKENLTNPNDMYQLVLRGLQSI